MTPTLHAERAIYQRLAKDFADQMDGLMLTRADLHFMGKEAYQIMQSMTPSDPGYKAVAMQFSDVRAALLYLRHDAPAEYWHNGDEEEN